MFSGRYSYGAKRIVGRHGGRPSMKNEHRRKCSGLLQRMDLTKLLSQVTEPQEL
jgi:hypothetical protein